jgi:N-acetylmuramoyl-L-alanine amidase
MLNGGGYGDVKLFNQATMARFLSPAGPSNSIGLGWQLANDKAQQTLFGPYASASAYGHTSWTGTAVVIDPIYDLAIILLTNKRHSKITAIEDSSEKSSEKGPEKSSEKSFEFATDAFETGKYASIISMIYEALIEFEAQNQLQDKN